MFASVCQFCATLEAVDIFSLREGFDLETKDFAASQSVFKT